MPHMRKTPTLELVRMGTGRDPQDLIREMYVDRRHSDREIAEALTAAAAFPISRAAVQAWRKAYGITRDDRPAVAL
jgi:hypothetical protein